MKIYGIIYKIKNKINNKHYIGQTTKEKGFDGRYCFKGEGIERVYNYHLNCKEKGYASLNSHLLNSINKYGFDAFEITSVIDVAFSKTELNIKEKCWVSIFDSYKNGYNQNLGGDGNKGHKALKGADNPTSRKIIQLDLKGNYIRTWDFIRQAYEELKISRTGIVATCKGRNKSCGNFIWVYEEEYDTDKNYKTTPKKLTEKEIYQLDLNGNIIDKYKSATEATKQNEYHYTSLCRCCAGNRNTYKGYIWKYKEDYENEIKEFNTLLA